MHRYLFIDRDGTLIEEPPDTQQVDRCSRLRLLPGVLSVLRWAQEVGGYRLVMITNQDGLGTSTFPETHFWEVQRLLMEIFASEGIKWYGLHIDRSRSDSPSFFRKPSPLFLLPYIRSGIDADRSFVIGDRVTDMHLAERLGLRGLWMKNPLHPRISDGLSATPVESWQDVYAHLRRALFSTRVVRQTRETAITLDLSLYGEGRTCIQTGLGFLDHMIELLAFHAGWDIELRAKGDLHVDAHHTVEDVAIVIGRALRELLNDKRGLYRYGQWSLVERLLPMDESAAFIAIDLSGRGVAVWEATFADSPGGISPSLWKHFFETLAREGTFTLHLYLRGEDAHHMIEAAFKGTGRALREALQRSLFSNTLPSTKGILG